MERHGVITEYEIMVEQLISFGERNSESILVDSRNLSIILMDLEEYVEYNISVRGYTSVGPGPYSMGIVRRTLEDGKKSDLEENLLYYFEIFLQCLQVHQRT